jgi:hypothetical protein
MVKLNVEHIREISEEYRRINKLSLSEIEFYENGKKLDIDPQVIKSAINMAISATWFVNGEYYKNDWRKV